MKMASPANNGAGIQAHIAVQYALPRAGLPAAVTLRRVAYAALGSRRYAAEIVIRIVAAAESARLNHRYRGKRGATNVLSFTYARSKHAVQGDIILCAPVILREARLQGKEPHAHWAHMVTHGMLHLLGMDHQFDAAARRMEARERFLLGGMGFSDPYSA